MTITMIPLDEEATDAQAPDDAWLEQAIRDQVIALLEGPHVASSPYAASYQPFWNRVDAELINSSAIYSYAPCVIAIIPIRLPVGSDRVVVEVYARHVIQADPFGAPGVRLTAVLLSPGLALRTVPGAVTVLPGEQGVWDLSFDLVGPAPLERVVDVVVLMQCARDTEAWGSITNLSAGVRAYTRTTPDAFASANDQLRADSVLVSQPRVGAPDRNEYYQYTEPANSLDLANATNQYKKVNVYESLTAEGLSSEITLNAYTLPGLLVSSIAIGYRRDAEAAVPDRSRLRAGVVVEGAAHAALEELVQLTQDAPRPLLARPQGDEMVGEVRERRGWRCATGARPSILDELVWIDRDYGEIEVQLRVISVSSVADLETDGALVWAAIGTYGATPAPVVGVAIASQATLRAWGPPPSEGPGRVLRDLARHYTGTLAIPGVVVSAFVPPMDRNALQTSQGYRAGTMLQGELALVDTIVLRMPVPAGHDSTKPLRIRVELDPDDDERPGSIWSVASLVACVGASITWDGRGGAI